MCKTRRGNTERHEGESIHKEDEPQHTTHHALTQPHKTTVTTPHKTSFRWQHSCAHAGTARAPQRSNTTDDTTATTGPPKSQTRTKAHMFYAHTLQIKTKQGGVIWWVRLTRENNLMWCIPPLLGLGSCRTNHRRVRLEPKKKKTLWDDDATMFHWSLMCIQTQNQPRLKRSNGHRSGMTLLHSLDAHVDRTFVEVAPVMARLASLGSLDRHQISDMMIFSGASALVSAVVVHVSAHHQHRLEQLRRETSSTPSL